jgi:hypothetical protein
MGTHEAMAHLAQWRKVLMRRQCGLNNAAGVPQNAGAIEEHHEATLTTQAQLAAVMHLLVTKGICTMAEFDAALGQAAQDATATLEQRFPGFTASDHGVAQDARANDTMAGWPL